MTSKFGWLQASATRNFSAAVSSEHPATIRIDSRPPQYLDVAILKHSPMQSMTSDKPTSRYQSSGFVDNFCP
jgi:hypothetical protein